MNTQEIMIRARHYSNIFNIPYNLAYAIFLREMVYKYKNIKKELSSELQKCIDELDDIIMTKQTGIAMDKVDPILKLACKDKSLNIQFMDCTDLSQQCEIALCDALFAKNE